MSSKRLLSSFYNKPCLELGRSLLGQVVVRMVDGVRLSGRIIEVECYLGSEDKACAGFGGKRTPSNEAVFMKAGTAFVYMTYGMYFCFNISSPEDGASAFIRAIEPLEGVEVMQKLRVAKMKNKDKELPLKELGNGPAKLCSSLGIDKNTFNQKDLSTCEFMWLERGDEIEDERIVAAPRIGINKAGEWTHKPLRFYVSDSLFVSVRDKAAEESAHIKESKPEDSTGIVSKKGIGIKKRSADVVDSKPEESEGIISKNRKGKKSAPVPDSSPETGIASRKKKKIKTKK